MKLRNKKTGEIDNWCIDKDVIRTCSGSIVYNSLAELNEEWEDYEEPKESEYYWYIGYKNDIRRTKYHHISDFADNQVTATRKEIGNCFESLEEAEKAMEKLKAWKRLKDNGFEFDGIRLEGSNCLIKTKLKDNTGVTFDHAQQFYEDVDLLFGGEE